MAKFTKDFYLLPSSVQQIVLLIVNSVTPQKIILFGSRARGNHRENSDFDLAVVGKVDEKKWLDLKVDLYEKNLSLFSIDLVKLEELSEDYK